MTPQQLKNSILQLAIQGKLVEQIPSDGTAEELYTQVQNEKRRLIAENKIKKSKPSPAITEDEIPFDIPESWKWVHFCDIAESSLGKTLNAKTDVGEDTPYLCSINVYWDGINLDNVKTAKFTVDQRNKYMLKKGDLLVCEGGDAGRSCVWNSNSPMWYQNALHCIRFYGGINSVFYKYVMELYKANGLIDASCRGVTIKHFVQGSLYSLPIPLPSLNEQNRIVDRIHQLFKLVDRYGEAWSKLEAFNQKFPEDMKKSILQQAIQGKLVEQRTEEGTADELFAHIQDEKRRLVISKKIKKDASYVPITEDEIPFEIPQSWMWVRLGDVLMIERGGSPRPIKAYLTDSPEGINWIKIGDTDKGGKYINHTAEKIIKAGVKKSRYVHKGDFLLSNSMSFGRPYILNIDGCIHDGWLVLHQIEKIFDNDYLFYLLTSPMVFNQFCKVVSGAVVNNLNKDKVAITIVPLPPLGEQKRIVKKIEELLSLCDSLIK